MESEKLERVILVAAQAWWQAHMPNSHYRTAKIAGDGRVDVYWQDADEDGRYTLPVDFLTEYTRAPADLRSALEAETIKKLRDAAALVARAIGVTQMPDGTASALVFSGNDPGPQLEDILSARAAIASLEGHVS